MSKIESGRCWPKVADVFAESGRCIYFHRTLVITQMKRSKVADVAYVRKWPMHIFPMYVGYDS